MSLRTKTFPTVLAILLFACGCTAGKPVHSSENEQTASLEQKRSANSERKDLSRWALPTDPYNPPPLVLRSAAINTLMVDCMAKQGINIPSTTYHLEAGSAETRSSNGQRLFSPEIAMKYGYREPADPRVDPVSSRNAKQVIRSLTSEQLKVMENCAEQAQHILQEPVSDASESEEARSEVDYWQWGSFRSPDLESAPFMRAAEEWRTCMAPLGISDLDERPSFGPPSQTLAAQWGYLEDMAPDQEPTPSETEIRVATQDAKCQVQSGYLTLLYEEQWRLDAEFVESNRKDLERLRQEYEALTQRYRDALSTSH